MSRAGGQERSAALVRAVGGDSGPGGGAGPNASGNPVLVLEATTLLEDVVPPAADPIVIKVGEDREFEGLIRLWPVWATQGWTRLRTRESSPYAAASSTSSLPRSGIPFGWNSGATKWRACAASPCTRSALWGLWRGWSFTRPRRSDAATPVGILSLLPAGTRVIRTDPLRARSRVEAFQADLVDVLGDEAGRGGYTSWSDVKERLSAFPSLTLSSLSLAAGAEPPLSIRATSGELAVTSLPEAEACASAAGR